MRVAASIFTMSGSLKVSSFITGNETKEPDLIKELKDSKFMNGYYRGRKKNVRSWKRNALK
jgi:hypothetical protein